jgi:septal ring factor EnvC (AmiA/AmiB activator)
MSEILTKLMDHDQRFTAIDKDIVILKEDVRTLKEDVRTLKVDLKSLDSKVDEHFKYLGSLMEDQARTIQLIYEIVQTNKQFTHSKELLDDRFERHDIRIAAVEPAYRELRR